MLGQLCLKSDVWYPGGGIGGSMVGLDLLGCIDTCSERNDCVGIEFKPADNQCYLKSTLVASDYFIDSITRISWQRFCEGNE